MRRQPPDDVMQAARRRLELLRRELELGRAEGPDDSGEPDPPLSPPLAGAAPVPEPGRHVRRSFGSWSLVSGWLADRLPATLRGRVGLGPAQICVVVVLVAAGLVVASLTVLRSGSGGDAVPVAALSTRGATPLVPSTSASASAAGTTSASASRQVTVDVAGKVRRPGVRTLPAGSRVIDAIRRAGGPRHGVDLSSINLARVLVDGEQIVVGVAPAPGAAASAASSPGAAAPTSPMVNLNSATLEQLESLPGVGPVTAQKILAWRQAHGAFSAVDELLEVDGIGDKTLADLAPYVTL